jgi:hypothetical protein
MASMSVLTLCLAMLVLPPIASESVDDKEGASIFVGGRNYTGWGAIRRRVIPVQRTVVIIAQKALAHVRKSLGLKQCVG